MIDEQFYVITVLKKYGSFLCVSRFQDVHSIDDELIKNEIRGSKTIK